MRVLVVEDEPEWADVLEEEFSNLGVTMTHCSNRVDAETVIAGDDEFDLAVVDQRIPADSDSLATDESHGRFVVRTLRSRRPGTPVVVLSGFQADPQELLHQAQREDYLGTGTPRPMLEYFEKSHLLEFVDLASMHCEENRALENIELDVPANLNYYERKAIRIFARRRGGAQVRVRPIGGGLSSSSVAQLTVLSGSGRRLCNVLVKVDMLDEISREISNFQQVTTLRSQFYASQVDVVTAGASQYGAIVYDYAVEGEQIEDVFFSLVSGVDDQEQLASRIKDAEGRWLEGLHQTEMTVGQVILTATGEQDILNLLQQASAPQDVDVDRLAGNVSNLWNRPLTLNVMCQHGDLHGANVLLRQDRSVVLIDFARVGDAPAALDPISLELSLLFHPTIYRQVEWSNGHSGNGWLDVDTLCAGSPFDQFIRACRAWTEEVCGGRRAMYAVGLGVALRQLRFEPERHPIALRVAQECADALAATY